MIADYNIKEEEYVSIFINNIDINTVYYYDIRAYRNPKTYETTSKNTLCLCQCSGECIKNNIYHKCKLKKAGAYREAVFNCPYVYNIYNFKEPKKNSKLYVLWHYLKRFLIYREIFGKYVNYLCLNDQFTVNDVLYTKLKKIPEFSLKNAFYSELDLEEIKNEIVKDPNYSYRISTPSNEPFFCSLLQFYKNEIEKHRQFINCRILMDEDTVRYLNWKDFQDEPFIEIGNYYFINFCYTNTSFIRRLPNFFFRHQYEDSIIYISFLKKDINLVYEYGKTNILSPSKHENRYILESLQKILGLDDNE